DAVDLLISKTEEEAKQKVTSVNTNNLKRQNFDKGTHQQALEIVENDEALQESYTTVLFNPEWHKGVIGIAASRLIENYFRPTILLTESNGLAVGSARSVPDFNLYEALKQCDDLLEQYGGHKAAAGLALKKENLEAFTQKFEEVVQANIHPELLIPVLEYDIELAINEITPSFCRTIQRFGPFGPENMKPVLYSKNAKNKYPPKVVGENHLKLFIGQEEGGLDAIAFNLHHYLEPVQDGKPFDICYTIEENVWNGKVNVQAVVNHVSVNVEQGEIVGLLGPNGAGKTTTFYMMVGLIKPDKGRIFLDNLELTKEPMYKRGQRGIGYLAQEASVFRKLTVEENIKAILEITKKSKQQQNERLEQLINEFGLEKVRYSKGDLISGGERRRTEIARALAADPNFILLDEPFAGVDPIAVEDIQSIVAKLKKINIGILITDHNVQETLSITDRTYLLFEGKILKAGTAEELAEDEQVRRVYLGKNFELKRKKSVDEGS
ncbi:MAG: LPS export ABC transporter ATP-binding protein, partial [Bacteroidetes bacterium SW_10_40_5]